MFGKKEKLLKVAKRAIESRDEIISTQEKTINTLLRTINSLEEDLKSLREEAYKTAKKPTTRKKAK